MAEGRACQFGQLKYKALPPKACRSPLMLNHFGDSKPNGGVLAGEDLDAKMWPFLIYSPAVRVAWPELPGRLCQAMAAAVTLALALHAQKSGDQIDVAMAKSMQQREEYLRQETARLLQETEESRAAQEATLLSVLQPWLCRTLAGVLLLMAQACWLVKKTKLFSKSYSEQDSCRSKEEEDKQEQEDLSEAHSIDASLAMFSPLSRHRLLEMCKVLKELVGDLLGVCRVLCMSTFMPLMHPATGMDSTGETWSIEEDSISYGLFVILQPPPGHSFSLEQDTTGQLPARPLRIHMALECMCWREQLLGDMLGFLHHHNDKLRRDQSSRLLRTLCMCSYLDMEKVTCWVSALVRSAWLLLSQSRHCRLTVLPSSRSCRFQLASTSEMDITIEMRFAVQPGSSDTYLSLK
ncbi:uncharacterized protein LOC141942766 isoform X1 [Strix uralensis]|uniref:uncharacterized protein LOC141942766 isoform X1 n=2 Tax=Strix uralensis TaxID=36305 RepID=UPI003DA77967